MPTYEYECASCGRFEVSQKMNDKPLDKCPKCHKKVKRLIGSGSGIIFKGSGFYATDYRKKPAGDKPQAKSNGPPAGTQACPKRKEGCNACQL